MSASNIAAGESVWELSLICLLYRNVASYSSRNGDDDSRGIRSWEGRRRKVRNTLVTC